MKSVRERFEEIWPVPQGVCWDYDSKEYVPRDYKGCDEFYDSAVEWDARLDTFTRCQEMMSLPEITEGNVHFALCCQMEDPSDDEESGFYAGVSWCLAFIKQEIAKRNKK